MRPFLRPLLFSLFASTLSGLTLASGAGAETFSLTRGTHVYFTSSENKREQQFTADLPPSSAAYRQATLNVKLSCPAPACDRWDRIGSFGIVDGSGNYLELLRFMTPYGIGEQWSLDVSPFLPLLQGKQTFRVFIDTWVGPGHPQGSGWLVDASLDMAQGAFDGPRPVLVLPLLKFEEVPYGDPTRPARREAQLLSIIGYSAARIITTVTGHGQGNAENCAEFCAKNHQISVGSQRFDRLIWRDDCATSVNTSQKGNYMYSRAGWCPGDKVTPWSVDVTNALLFGDLKFSYAAEGYENSCRPDAASCGGCTLGTGCAYDGGLHTEPRYMVSAYAIYYQ